LYNACVSGKKYFVSVMLNINNFYKVDSSCPVE
jgi:hypothetical protein